MTITEASGRDAVSMAPGVLKREIVNTLGTVPHKEVILDFGMNLEEGRLREGKGEKSRPCEIESLQKAAF